MGAVPTSRTGFGGSRSSLSLLSSPKSMKRCWPGLASQRLLVLPHHLSGLRSLHAHSPGQRDLPSVTLPAPPSSRQRGPEGRGRGSLFQRRALRAVPALPSLQAPRRRGGGLRGPAILRLLSPRGASGHERPRGVQEFEGELLATGYADFLPGGISSVYFAFEPDQARRSLGAWSVLREAALARESGRRYYYLGFWVPGAAKMDYKANFAPFEVARHGHWQFRRNRDAAIAEPGLGLESALAPVPAVVVEKP